MYLPVSIDRHGNALQEEVSVNGQEVLRKMEEIGAVITDSHIVYTSGEHGSAYVNKDAIYPHTQVMSRLSSQLAATFMSERVEVVVGPATGAAILSQWVAHHLSSFEMFNRQVLAAYAEKGEASFLWREFAQGEPPGFIIARGYDKLIAGKRTLVVEDVLNTGGSARKVVEAVRGVGGIVMGVGALCSRGDVTAQELGDVPKLASLLDVSLESWRETDCPLCADGIPVNVSVGKGREFLSRKQA